VITNHQQTQLWYVIEDMINCGVSPREFKQEAAACWEQALREKLRDEPKEIAE